MQRSSIDVLSFPGPKKPHQKINDVCIFFENCFLRARIKINQCGANSMSCCPQSLQLSIDYRLSTSIKTGCYMKIENQLNGYNKLWKQLVILQLSSNILDSRLFERSVYAVIEFLLGIFWRLSFVFSGSCEKEAISPERNFTKFDQSKFSSHFLLFRFFSQFFYSTKSEKF